MSARNDGKALGIAIFLIAVAAIGFLVLKPEVFRIRGVQVPAGVSVRNSAVGIGNVVQVRNTSDKTLYNVTLDARNPHSNESATYTIDQIQPGETEEVGWLEWGWKVAPGETITISSGDYLPIVFSSEQLGIR